MNNKRQLKELFKVNLLYANPQVTDQLRKKGKYGNDIFKSILLQQAFLGILFVVLYGASMFIIDFSTLPGVFTNYMAMFGILSFSQGVSVVFNVFFDSKDFEDYLPLPFSERNIFLAKMLIVGFFLLPFSLPIIALFILTANRSSVTPILMVPISIVVFLLFFAILLTLVICLVSLLVQTKVFNRFKTLLTTLLMFIPTVGMLAGMMYLNHKQSEVFDSGVIKDQTVIPVLDVFHQLLVYPFSLKSVLGVLGLLVLCLGLSFFIKKRVLPSMQNNYQTLQATPKTTSYKGLRSQLIKYHFNLIKNPTLQMQMLSSLIIFPVIFLVPILINGQGNFSFLTIDYFIVLVVGGVLFSAFTLGANSLASVIISLDQSNLTFIKSLPISFKEYIKLKFNFAFILQTVLSSVIILATCLLVKLNVLLMIGMLIGNFFGCYAGTSYYLKRDSKYLSLNWTNVNQLFNRGMGSFQVVASLFGVMLVGGIIILVLVTIINITTQVLLVNLVGLLLLIIVLVAYQMFINKNFWNDLKE